jgi:hypothetical protein
MDAALVVAADRVSAEIAQMLGGASAAKPARKMLKKRPENSMVA